MYTPPSSPHRSFAMPLQESDPALPVLGVPLEDFSRRGGRPSRGAAAAGLVPPLAPSTAPLAASLDSARILDPPMLCCALSHRLMSQPMLADDGYTYEADIIENWRLAGNHCSPVTEQPLVHDTLIPNENLALAIGALTNWQRAGSLGDVRVWLQPAIIDPGGSHNPMLQPMTLSDGTTCDASNLASMFAAHPVRSPITQQLWQQHFEEPRYNRALQELAAAVLGIEPPAFPPRRRYPTWQDPTLQMPPPSSRQPYRSFCCGYRGYTWRLQGLPIAAGFAVGCPVGIVTSAPAGAAAGVGIAAYLGVNGLLRAVDYGHYRQANADAAVLYEAKVAEAYATFNAQRQAIGLLPETQQMQR